MVCPHCEGAEKVFSNSWAQEDLKTYLKKGASKTTKTLVDVLVDANIKGMSLLDIGGGVGAIQHSLMQAGASQAVGIDASAAYIAIAQAEAQKRGYADNAKYIHGDFVQQATNVEAADIVTLDRVICCYPDMQALVDLSSKRAKQFYAVVYPRDNIITKLGIRVFNFFAFRIRNSPFRTYIHDSSAIDAIIRNNGLKHMFHQYTGFWQIRIYQR